MRNSQELVFMPISFICFSRLTKPVYRFEIRRLLWVDWTASTTERSRDFRISWWRFTWDFGIQRAIRQHISYVRTHLTADLTVVGFLFPWEIIHCYTSMYTLSSTKLVNVDKVLMAKVCRPVFKTTKWDYYSACCGDFLEKA